MSKEVFSKRNCLNVKTGQISTKKTIEHKDKDNSAILQSFLKQKGLKVQVFNKKDLVRKAATPEIIKKKIMHLKTIEPNINKQFTREIKENRTFDTIAACSNKGRNRNPLIQYNTNAVHNQNKTLNVKLTFI